jgi:E3 Ubiquitin ligase
LADPSDFFFWLLMLGVAVVGGGWIAFRWLHIARLLEDTPTSRVRSAAQGYVELAGRSKAMAGAPDLAPLTQRPCVWWRYRIQRRTGSASRGRQRARWQTVNSGRSEQPFLLDDGTGQCVVQPSGAEVLTAETTSWYGDTPWPTQPPGRRSPFGEPEYRYYEERIYENEQVHVLGQFRTLTGVGQRDREADVMALLAEWKQDQAELARRFDADGDGRVSLEEWERARQEARHAVTQRHLEQPVPPALHVVVRPDGRQLFLIASYPEQELARRFRRRAIVAFVGFAAATYALAWLLQGVFGSA